MAIYESEFLLGQSYHFLHTTQNILSSSMEVTMITVFRTCTNIHVKVD